MSPTPLSISPLYLNVPFTFCLSLSVCLLRQPVLSQRRNSEARSRRRCPVSLCFFAWLPRPVWTWAVCRVLPAHLRSVLRCQDVAMSSNWIPERMAAMATCAREEMPRMRRMLLTWTLTVPSANPSSLQMLLFGRPSIMSRSTLRWRSLRPRWRPSRYSRCGCAGAVLLPGYTAG